ncbi:MAG: sulfotransferase [Puniceicoccaceae bacterium]
MFPAFFRSLRLHFQWWIRSFLPGKHPDAPAGLRRAVFLLLLYPAFLAAQLIHWAGFLLDALFFPGDRKVAVEAPVFIAGVPRSGTTFLHRVLARDPDCFRSFRMWEALLAPSVTERKCLRALAGLDRALGRPVRRPVDRLLERRTAGFDAIHAVDLSAPEEDYLALLPFGACFLLFMAFPFAPELEQLARFDTLPPRRRSELLHLYRRCLQKHLYASPPGGRILSKNAAFASWIPSLLEAFPGAVCIVCVREPASALSSQLSALGSARKAFGTDPDGSGTARRFAGIFAHDFALLASLADSGDPRLAFVDLGDLKAAPAASIESALRLLRIEPSETLIREIRALRPNHRSRHQHEPDTAERRFEARVRPDYGKILASPRRVSRSAHP